MEFRSDVIQYLVEHHEEFLEFLTLRQKGSYLRNGILIKDKEEKVKMKKLLKGMKSVKLDNPKAIERYLNQKK